MNPFISRLVTNIPGGLPVPTDTFSALSLAGSGSVSLSGNTLYMTVGATSAAFDLYGLTVTQLADQINAQFGVVATSAATVGLAELLTLPNQVASSPLPVSLSLPSDPTDAVLGMMGRLLEGNKRFANAEAAQVNLQAALTRCADWWGASVGIPRFQGEPDAMYMQRLVAMRFGPTQNNFAIQKLFATLGYKAAVYDVSPGTFNVQASRAGSSTGYAYTTGQMLQILNRVKSAGYQATLDYSTSSMISSMITLIAGIVGAYPVVVVRVNGTEAFPVTFPVTFGTSAALILDVYINNPNQTTYSQISVTQTMQQVQALGTTSYVHWDTGSVTQVST